jgi:hypothetical protein
LLFFVLHQAGNGKYENMIRMLDVLLTWHCPKKKEKSIISDMSV